MTSSYSKGFGRIALLGNEKFDHLIKKSATRWCSGDQMVKELLIATISYQNEIDRRVIENTEVCLEGNIYLRLREKPAHNRHLKKRQIGAARGNQSNFPKRLLK